MTCLVVRDDPGQHVVHFLGDESEVGVACCLPPEPDAAQLFEQAERASDRVDVRLPAPGAVGRPRVRDRVGGRVLLDLEGVRRLGNADPDVVADGEIPCGLEVLDVVGEPPYSGAAAGGVYVRPSECVRAGGDRPDHAPAPVRDLGEAERGGVLVAGYMCRDKPAFPKLCTPTVAFHSKLTVPALGKLAWKLRPLTPELVSGPLL